MHDELCFLISLSWRVWAQERRGRGVVDNLGGREGGMALGYG